MNLNLENPKFLSDTKLIKNNNDVNISNSYQEDNDEEENSNNPRKIELSVNKFFQSFNMSIGHDPFYNKSLKFESSEEDIFIEKDFIFALINFEVLTDLNIPSISVNVISRDNWIKEK